MPTKTLYVKDQQLWEKAGRLAGPQGLSGVIMQLLAKWVADKENHEAMKSGKEFAEIELWVGGDEHSRWHPRDPVGRDYKVAFTGRLLASTEQGSYYSTSPVVEVYELRNGRLAVYRAFESMGGIRSGAACLVYADFQTLRDDPAALDTCWWVDDSKDVLEVPVPPFTARTERGEQGIEEVPIEVEREAYDLNFLKDISDALGAEMIVRIG